MNNEGITFYETKKRLIPDNGSAHVICHHFTSGSKFGLLEQKKSRSRVLKIDGVKFAFDEELQQVIDSIVMPELEKAVNYRMGKENEYHYMRKKVSNYNKLPWWKKIFTFNI